MYVPRSPLFSSPFSIRYGSTKLQNSKRSPKPSLANCTTTLLLVQFPSEEVHPMASTPNKVIRERELAERVHSCGSHVDLELGEPQRGPCSHASRRATRCHLAYRVPAGRHNSHRQDGLWQDHCAAGDICDHRPSHCPDCAVE